MVGYVLYNSEYVMSLAPDWLSTLRVYLVSNVSKVADMENAVLFTNPACKLDACIDGRLQPLR